MKLLLDFLPIVAFFAAYFLAPDRAGAIYLATATAIVATLVQVAVTFAIERHVPRMQWVTLVLMLVLGGLTLALADKRFILWKPTVVNWLFALVFAASGPVTGKPLVERMMEHVMRAPRPVWQRLNAAWVAFFFALGLANLYVAHHWEEANWVNFKLFGSLALTLVFVAAQGAWLARHAEVVAPETREH